ncbi:MAG: hypothetical protein ACR2MF_05935 [Chthoniobacterales bacterium]
MVTGYIARCFALILFACIGSACMTSCQTTSSHKFAEPTKEWRVRSGQLLYKGPKTTLIGEVLVRFSKNGDFELTFTKGPGVTLLMVRQDPTFIRLTGPLTRGSWSGAPSDAPGRLRGWVGLREELMRARANASVRHTFGNESFVFRF